MISDFEGANILDKNISANKLKHSTIVNNNTIFSYFLLY